MPAKLKGWGGPAGTLPTPGVPEPCLQRKQDVRLDTSRPVLTGWSFYFYIHTSRLFSCSREKLTEKGGPGVAPWGGRQPAASVSWHCSQDRAVSRGTAPCGGAWGTPGLAWASQAGGLRDAAGTGLVPRGATRRGLERPLPTRLGCPACMLLSPPDSPFQPQPAMP